MTNEEQINILTFRYNLLLSRGFYNIKIAKKIARKIRALGGTPPVIEG